MGDNMRKKKHDDDAMIDNVRCDSTILHVRL